LGIKERKVRQRREVRSRILLATREIASSEGGWLSVTIRKIAERIEYSPPVIYEHFDSKEEILRELLRIGYAEQLEAVESARKAAAGPEEAVFGIMRAYLRFAFGSPDLYQVMYGLGGVSFSALSATEAQRGGERIGDEAGKAIEKILSKYGKGEARDVNDEVTRLWSTAHGLVALAMAGRLAGGQKEAERLAEQAVREALTTWRSG
jgi:AcrR family transcriptional regulator